ncbi:transposase [Streptomyces thermogriseus]|uniref:transposase n=1 Tax=Streptomyces thermogriseus TaxID=75292 RepID=UPI00360A532E
MAGKRRPYDAALRAGAVRHVAEAGKSTAEVARNQDVQPRMLQNWVHRARAG